MNMLESYESPRTLPASEQERVCSLLGLTLKTPDAIAVTDMLEEGFDPELADRMQEIFTDLGLPDDFTALSKSTLLKRANQREHLTTEMSERIYDMGRILDAAGFAFRGNRPRVSRFLSRPNPILQGKTPLQMAVTSKGAQIVVDLLNQAEAGFPV